MTSPMVGKLASSGDTEYFIMQNSSNPVPSRLFTLRKTICLPGDLPLLDITTSYLL